MCIRDRYLPELPFIQKHHTSMFKKSSKRRLCLRHKFSLPSHALSQGWCRKSLQLSASTGYVICFSFCSVLFIVRFHSTTESTSANHLIEANHTYKNIDNNMNILHVHTKGRKLDTLEQLEIYKHTKTNKNDIPVSYTHLDVYKRQVHSKTITYSSEILKFI